VIENWRVVRFFSQTIQGIWCRGHPRRTLLRCACAGQTHKLRENDNWNWGPWPNGPEREWPLKCGSGKNLRQVPRQ